VVSLMSLPSGASTRVPEPSIKPVLEAPVFSEALGFTDYPGEWLPFSGAKSVTVFDGPNSVGQLSAGPAEEFTVGVITDQAKQVRYALGLKHDWTVEQEIEVADWDAGVMSGEHIDEGDDE